MSAVHHFDRDQNDVRVRVSSRRGSRQESQINASNVLTSWFLKYWTISFVP